MRLHDAELLRVEASRFEQDGVGNGDLADVVQEGPLDERAHLPAAKAQRFREAQRIERDPVVVGIGVAVALGDRGAEQRDALEIRAEQAFGVIRQSPGLLSHDGVDGQGGRDDDRECDERGAQDAAAFDVFDGGRERAFREGGPDARLVAVREPCGERARADCNQQRDRDDAPQECAVHVFLQRDSGDRRQTPDGRGGALKAR